MRTSAGIAWLVTASLLLFASPMAPGAAPAPAPPPRSAPVATRALLARLRAAGRAEADLRVRRVDVLSGRRVTTSAALALELPRFVRLDLAGGERLSLREDGGDWLQPATRQLVRAGPREAAGFLSWCAALLDPGGSGVVARPYGERRYVLERPGSGDPPVRVELGADGLPRSISVGSGADESTEYRVARWRFLAPRGRAAFVLQPPPGYEVVEMP
jgi:hypothetical protein